MFDDADWAETTNATVRVLTGGTYARDPPPELALTGEVIPNGTEDTLLRCSRSDSSSTRDRGGRVEESGIVPNGGGGGFEEGLPLPEEVRWGGSGRRLERASLSAEKEFEE